MLKLLNIKKINKKKMICNYIKTHSRKFQKNKQLNKGAPCCTPVNNSPSRGDK